MSAGAGAMRFSGYFDFYFNSIQTGGDVTQNIQIIDNRVQNFTQNMQKSTSAASNYSSGLRRLALDLRLISSGIRQVVSTLGLQDTIIGKAADGVTILTSSVVVAISAFNAWTRLNTVFSGQILGATMQAIVTLTPAVAFLTANLLPLIAIVALLAAGFIAINYVWGETSGINRYRDSIKNLEEDVEDLEDSLKSLRLEQGMLGVQSAALAAEQARLDAQLSTGAISAETYAQKSELLDANRATLGAQTAELAFTESFYQSQVDQSKASIDDYNQAIKDTEQAAWNTIMNRSGDEPRMGGPNAVPTQRPGLLNEVGEMISLTISLEGANIFGKEGITEALQVGGERLKKQLEYMRRPRARW